MMALRAHRRGGPEQLVLERAPRPVLAAGEVLVAVQLAAMLGARVTATVRSDTANLLRGCGAQRVIDVRTEAFDETGAGYDVVIDTVGGPTLERSFGVLRRGGRLVTLSAPPPEGCAAEFGVTATFSSSRRIGRGSTSSPRWSMAIDCTSRSPRRSRSTRVGRRSKAATTAGAPARRC